jgi:hypothetical protein
MTGAALLVLVLWLAVIVAGLAVTVRDALDYLRKL